MIFLPFVVFLLGLIVGSFLNVVILRMNTGRSYVKGKSKCASCSRNLEWYELIPVFSFLALKGKCRTCLNEISFQYPVVELITALVFTLLYIKIPLVYAFTSYAWLSFVLALAIASILIVILVYDFRHKIIPDSAVYAFIILSVASVAYKALTIPGFPFFPAIASGVVVALPFFFLWLLSKGKAMGFGDVKLALGIGWLLGITGGFTAILLAFWVGGIFGLFLLALTHRYHMKSQIPFAPFLIIGIFIVGVWGVSISNLFSIWP